MCTIKILGFSVMLLLFWDRISAQDIVATNDNVGGTSITDLIEAYVITKRLDVTSVASRLSETDALSIMPYLSDPDREVRWRAVSLASQMGAKGKDIIVSALKSEIAEVPVFALSECPRQLFQDAEVRNAWMEAYTTKLGEKSTYEYREKLRELCESDPKSRIIMIDRVIKEIESREPCRTRHYVVAMWNLAEYGESENLEILRELQKNVEASEECVGLRTLITAVRADLGDATAVEAFAQAIGDVTPSTVKVTALRLLESFRYYRDHAELYRICRDLLNDRTEVGSIKSNDLTSYRVCDVMLGNMTGLLQYKPLPGLKRFNDKELESFQEWFDIRISELERASP